MPSSVQIESEKRPDVGVVNENTVVPALTQDEVEDEDQHAEGWQKIALIMLGVYLAMFLVALVCILSISLLLV